MSASSSSSTKLIGIVLLIIGCGLGYWGYEISQEMTSQITSQLTNEMPKEVMYRYIGAAVSGILGIVLLFKK
ncbi:DUF3185 family protein [Paraferrimonas sedimenticola]|uniref:DUF3185 family protein n=1 Tax=Paraferrimonas sedimenticola TaxID=375674 RepID=A0AA37S0F4_9GAMM|nr:DUF3185 family protein [Paraferrimonas sedimenticola]GLP98118.1 hypothetical protein GCM10007895_34250 [Paraferrimonas sedimenticola]